MPEPEFIHPPPLSGLVAATHTPFREDGSLNLAIVEKQAAHLLAKNVNKAFIGGSTGEYSSLSLDERLSLTQRWMEVARGTELLVVIHVGSNCLEDGRALAAHAERNGAAAIAALAPSHFKPRDVATLVACCAHIASAAPDTPFYFYDIPATTGVNISMLDFLAQARGVIPTLAGLKFSNPNLHTFQLLQCAENCRWNVLWGIDEYMLAALVLGATAFVGSTYNFAAPIYHRLMAAFERGDLAAARAEQLRSAQLVHLLFAHDMMGASKAVMEMVGVEVGPARLPHRNPTPAQRTQLREELAALGFFDWIAC
jgi:N-acetylneuraminate lyase